MNIQMKKYTGRRTEVSRAQELLSLWSFGGIKLIHQSRAPWNFILFQVFNEEFIMKTWLIKSLAIGD